MPKRDSREALNAYNREYYQRTKDTPKGKAWAARKKKYREEYWPEYYEKNKKEIVAHVKNNKYRLYGGKCKICGRVTMGQDKKHPGSDFCYDHRHEQIMEKKNAQ